MSSEPRRVRVTSYAGYRAEQEPRRFVLDGQSHDIAEIVRRWREPGADCFVVRTSGGPGFELCHDHGTDSWSAKTHG